MIFYRLLFTCLHALLLTWRASPYRLVGSVPEAERLVPPPRREGSAPALWIHAASNGELTAARPVIAELARRLPDASLLVTTNSRTGRALAAGWGLARTSVRLAPIDQRRLVRTLLDHLRPSALVMVENELWPDRMLECARRGIPVLVLGGRMSEKSFRFWSRLPGLARPILAAVRWLAPQDEGSRARFLALGLDPTTLGPTLLLKAAPGDSGLPADPPADRARTVLAASTHEGEEAAVLSAFAALRRAHPGLRLILAPRHPRRRDEIEALIAARGLAFATRSRGQDRDPALPIYLADTLGEMDRWYRAAGLCFVGGSLAARGGHTPFEPAAAGSVILHGPSLENFAAPYRALDDAGAALAVADADGLSRALAPLIGDAAAQARLAGAARAALAPFTAQSGGEDFFAALSDLTGLAVQPG
ncbi:MAG: 3-deoxy-D-manno-octulosonic acid transferase [Proteobacteria bacterium]|nr:3-deoxy-D-manno-octulosonic acid transferase [Pseudomonadota bacterium]MBS0574364.1 3-deoxy-D-manno-octulosonic acid transferase [Pseudomonadota bacterium]